MPTHRTVAVRGLLALAALTALTGCGPDAVPTRAAAPTASTSVPSSAAPAPSGAGASQGSAPEDSASQAPEATTTAAAPTAGMPCRGQALAGRLASSDGAAGHIHLVVALRNIGGVECTLDGFPAVGLVAQDGSALPVRATHDGDLAFPARTPSTVVLAPGEVASFDLGFSHVPAGGQTSCPAAQSLAVTTPGDSHPVAVQAVADPCDGGHLAVSPLVAGDQGSVG
ncbi:MAG TPA: DUF4232 domain-containing protein [Oryzihumus sp.]|nr:DUF4232 domain-containing protein [Oryzihumus sp.]